jgi:hypothetical protein
MAVVLEEAAEVLGISVKDIERQALRSLLEKELRSIRVEPLDLLKVWRELVGGHARLRIRSPSRLSGVALYRVVEVLRQPLDEGIIGTISRAWLS